MLKSEFFHVIVTDQKMPHLTGIELLQKAVSLAPYSSKIMVSGFSHFDLVQSAINEVGVFRFFSKPWKELEIQRALQEAAELSNIELRSKSIKKEIIEKNNRLKELTQNLEAKVIEQTDEFEESRMQAAVEEAESRDLVKLIGDLANSNSYKEIIETLKSSARRIFVSVQPFLIVKKDDSHYTMMGFRGPQFIEKDIGKNEELANVLGRPLGKINTYQISDSIQLSYETFSGGDESKSIERYMASRIEAIKIAFERLTVQNKVKLAGQDWEVTFDEFIEPIAIIKSDRTIVRSNKSFEQYSNKKHCYEVLFNQDSACYGCPISNPNSKILEMNQNVYDVKSNKLNEHFYIHIYRDITEKEHKKNKLRQGEKLAALGRLYDGLSHELSNPLTGLKSISELYLNDNELSNELRQDMQSIHAASVRSLEIIDDLASMAGKSIQTVSSVNVLLAISKTLPFIKTLTRNIDIDYSDVKKELEVPVPRSKFQQVLFNLIRNASQAIESKGQIKISANSVGGLIQVIVSDTGMGISDEVKKRLFQPFVTTKKSSSGTGLGLVYCKNIVEESGGQMRVESTLGHGASFIMEWPL